MYMYLKNAGEVFGEQLSLTAQVLQMSYTEVHCIKGNARAIMKGAWSVNNGLNLV